MSWCEGNFCFLFLMFLRDSPSSSPLHTWAAHSSTAIDQTRLWQKCSTVVSKAGLRTSMWVMKHQMKLPFIFGSQIKCKTNADELPAVSLFNKGFSQVCLFKPVLFKPVIFGFWKVWKPEDHSMYEQQSSVTGAAGLSRSWMKEELCSGIRGCWVWITATTGWKHAALLLKFTFISCFKWKTTCSFLLDVRFDF